MFLTRFSQELLWALNVFFIAQNVSDTFLIFVFSSTKLYYAASGGFRTKHFASVQQKTRMISLERMSYKIGKTFDKHCFILYFYSDKLSHYKTYDLRKFLIPDAFKHIRLQNTFNSCKVHQILPLMVDYACFLVKCINYKNVMCIQKIYFLQDFASFLQECHCIQEFCKNWTFRKNLSRFSSLAKNLQDLARNKFSVK